MPDIMELFKDAEQETVDVESIQNSKTVIIKDEGPDDYAIKWYKNEHTKKFTEAIVKMLKMAGVKVEDREYRWGKDTVSGYEVWVAGMATAIIRDMADDAGLEVEEF